MIRFTLFALATVAAAAACSSHASSERPPAAARDAALATAGSIDARPAPPDATALVLGTDGVARGPIPAQLDARIAAFLAEPVPDHVVVRFAEISRSDDPTGNTRWDLDRSGRLFFVRNSDKAAKTGFARGLPDKPSLHLDATHVRELFSALVAQRFYDHPGFETVPGAAGGTTVIVRARPRDGGELHTVVYDVSRPDLLDFLEVVTVSL